MITKVDLETSEHIENFTGGSFDGFYAYAQKNQIPYRVNLGTLTTQTNRVIVDGESLDDAIIANGDANYIVYGNTTLDATSYLLLTKATITVHGDLTLQGAADSNHAMNMTNAEIYIKAHNLFFEEGFEFNTSSNLYGSNHIKFEALYKMEFNGTANTEALWDKVKVHTDGNSFFHLKADEIYSHEFTKSLIKVYDWTPHDTGYVVGDVYVNIEARELRANRKFISNENCITEIRANRIKYDPVIDALMFGVATTTPRGIVKINAQLISIKATNGTATGFFSNGTGRFFVKANVVEAINTTATESYLIEGANTAFFHIECDLIITKGFRFARTLVGTGMDVVFKNTTIYQYNGDNTPTHESFFGGGLGVKVELQGTNKFWSENTSAVLFKRTDGLTTNMTCKVLGSTYSNVATGLVEDLGAVTVDAVNVSPMQTDETQFSYWIEN